MPKSSKIFISYSHDSDEHAGRVLDLANALRSYGQDVLIDQFQPYPPDGWTRWMERGLDSADFVLMICTPTYLRRVKDEEPPGVGLGVRWEGRLIKVRLYRDQAQAARFIPVLLAGYDPSSIPDPVWDHARYQVVAFDFQDPGFESLYRHLAQMPPAEAAELGDLVVLPTSRGGGRMLPPPRPSRRPMSPTREGERRSTRAATADRSASGSRLARPRRAGRPAVTAIWSA